MSAWLTPAPTYWLQAVEAALAEDVGHGDVTSACLPPDLEVSWMIEAQAEGVACGIGIAEHLLAPAVDDPEDCFLRVHLRDGDAVGPGTVLLEGRTFAQKALVAERTALNFLMHLSGVATLTARFVQAVEGTGARVVDTRKTAPGLRALQKYAVRCGGGANHRMGLFDGVMLKDNHLRALGGVVPAIREARKVVSHLLKVEVECESLGQAVEAVRAGADVILLDNMSVPQLREAVQALKGQAILEASGGVNLDTVRAIAETGVDLISVGSITHSAPALSLHMEIT